MFTNQYEQNNNVIFSSRYKVSRVAATKKEAKEDTTSHAQEAASKLLKKFRENSSASGIKRAPNGRFVKRTPTTD